MVSELRVTAWPGPPTPSSQPTWDGLPLPPGLAARLARPAGRQIRTAYRLGQGPDGLTAFGQRRPLVGQEKLCGFVGRLDLAGELLERIGRQVVRQGLVALKIESPAAPDRVGAAVLAAAQEAGYEALRPPVDPDWGPAAVPGVVGEAGRGSPGQPAGAGLGAAVAGAVAGWAKFWGRSSRVEVAYRRQSTPVTCGPSAALMALSALGHPTDPGRSEELALWRRANSAAGCDPFGLAVALAERGLAPLVQVSYPDTYRKPAEPWQVELRDWFQRGFQAQARALGLAVERRWVAVDEVWERLSAGAVVLALIDEFPFQGRSSLHWITLVGLAGPDHVLAQDPWIRDDQGESWVDAHALPLSRTGLDRLARFCPEGFRAWLVLEPS
ncbi:MAG: peptidase C39 family protein [Propionibacteriaceae bacterium]|jgi:hypothetical protein|nr:peptidase C39 family protein [Propionibacteriaceae bacterium]